MPTWGQILIELQEGLPKHQAQVFDLVRRKYLAALTAYTGRNTILYATKWTQSGVADPSLVSITYEDVQGLMEVVHGLDGSKGLDLIIHSPGGSPDAAESIVHYVRSKFSDVRVFVPHAAMSAATMIACAADRIVMGKHSSLGPIDPQFIVTTPQGGSTVLPAQAILDQFEMAKDDIAKDPALLGAWAPILPQYGPSMLMQSINALQLAEELASEWLTAWMFKGEPNAKDIASAIAKKLADHKTFKSHGRPIHRDAAQAMGLKIEKLEDDQTLQDLILSIYHATMHTFAATAAVKAIENHLGRGFFKQQQPLMIQMQPPVPPVAAPVPAPPPAP